MKILNLYGCLGGNRYKWSDEHDITAIELDSELANLYQKRFPKDKVIVTDAHKYLQYNYKEYDFIWSSPPCPSHSRARYWNCKNGEKKTKPIYPDLKLYEEIIFLQSYFKGKWVVENVIPYYEPLIPAKKRGRHLYWCNFNLPNILSNRKFIITDTKNELKELCEFHDYDFNRYKGSQRIDKIARNLVDYEAGNTILNIASGIIKENNYNSPTLF